MKDKVNLQGLKSIDYKKSWVLLYFSTSWCAPCKDMALIMDDISIEYINRLCLVKIDVDDEVELAREYGVKSVPTLILLDKLSNKSSLIGGVTSKQLKDWLDTQLA